MKKLIAFSMSLSLLGSLFAFAEDLADNPLKMSNVEINATFPGMTMVGKYSDGTNFRETYHPNGSITYVDDLSADKGHWFVRGKLFCTFYEVSNGACFSVQKSGKNCFEYFVEEEKDGNKIADAGAWNSIGWDDTKPSTCDLAPKTT